MPKRLIAKFLSTHGPDFLRTEFQQLTDLYKRGEIDVHVFINELQSDFDEILSATNLETQEVHCLLDQSLADFKQASFYTDLGKPKADVLRLQICVSLEMLRTGQPDDFLSKLAEACNQLRLALSLAGGVVNFNTFYVEELLLRYKTRVPHDILRQLARLLELENDTEIALRGEDTIPRKRKRSADPNEQPQFKKPKFSPQTTIGPRKDMKKLIVNKEVKMVKRYVAAVSKTARHTEQKPKTSENIKELVQIAQKAFYKPCERGAKAKPAPVLVKASPVKPRYSEDFSLTFRSIFKS